MVTVPSPGEGLMTLAYRAANGATRDDSPGITATWVPFPNVNFPLSPPVFTLQVTPLQKLRTPSRSVDRDARPSRGGGSYS